MATSALVCCLILIAILLFRDSRRRKTISWAIWIPTLFLLVVGSRPLSFWFGGSSWSGEGLANDASGNVIDQVFYFTLLVGSLAVATMRRVKWGEFLVANLPLILFYAYFAISISWSEDPMGSSKRLFKDFGMLFVIALLLSEEDPLEAIRAVYVRCAYVLFPLSAVTIKWFPQIARSFSKNGEPLYAGVTLQKNSLGEIVLVFSLFAIWDFVEMRPKRWKWSHIPWEHVFIVFIGMWLLRTSQSKTALVCLVLGTMLLIATGWLASRSASRIVLVGALSLPYMLFFATQFSSVIQPIVESMGRDMTFTGRTEIWQHIDSTTVNPIFGYGYYNFWGGSGGQRVNQSINMTIPNAHDGYLDIYLDGGIIALFLLVFVLTTYGWRLTKMLKGGRFQRLRFAVLIVAIVYNLSESNWARLSPIWFTTLLVLAYMPQLRARRMKSRVSNEADARTAQTLTPELAKSVYSASKTDRLQLTRR